jgi:hypothetical protein
MDDSYIEARNGATTFVGADAVRLYQVTALKHALILYMRSGIIPTRGMTITKMLASAGSVMGKRYRRGQLRQAIADLETWIAAMQSAMPVVRS